MRDTTHFKSFEYPSREETEIGGRDITDDFKEIESRISRIEEDQVTDDLLVLGQIIPYIKGPIIIDNFKDENERNLWLANNSNKIPEVYKLIESNKLKGNNIGGVLGFAALADLEANPKLFGEYQQFYEQYTGGKGGGEAGYGSFSLEKKLLFIRRFRNFTKELYQYIAAKYKK